MSWNRSIEPYSGWCLSCTSDETDVAEAEKCPVCGSVPDVITFSCAICGRNNICLHHQRGAKSWKGGGREVVIPNSCVQCWTAQHQQLKLAIAVVKHLRCLEIAGQTVIILTILSGGLLLVNVRVGALAVVASLVILMLIARYYFRFSKTHPWDTEKGTKGILGANNGTESENER